MVGSVLALLMNRDTMISVLCIVKCSRGDVGSLTRLGAMTIDYFSPPSERVFL